MDITTEAGALFDNHRGVHRLGGAGIRRFRPRGGHQNSPFRGRDYMIPYMVGRLVPNSSHLTRGLVKYVPGRGYFRAVSFQNGKICYIPPSPPQSLNWSTLDARIRSFYSTLLSLTLAPAPIWKMKHAMQETTSPTQSSGRKTSSGARSPLFSPSFLSLCRRMVRLAQTCIP